MVNNKRYTIKEKKELGAFYTPENLSDLLSYYILSLKKLDQDKEYTVVDPATGDSALLLSFLAASEEKGVKTRYVGIDIEKCATNQSNKLFKGKDVKFSFVNTDGLYPYNSKSPLAGWNTLKHKFMPNGINFFVSNPPWGADRSKYKSLQTDFKTAKGQYDIYDLFIETIIDNLDDGGCYGIIIPDSIYSEEHKPIRKYLLKETTLKRIVRLGEGFFPEVNIAVSILFGIKRRSSGYNVICSHLTNEVRKQVLTNNVKLSDAVKICECKIPVRLMTGSDFSFITDVKSTDVELMEYLRHCPSVGQYATSQRGIELSKKGNISQCPHCGKWFPEPKGKNEDIVKCQHCGQKITKGTLSSVSIIVNTRMPDSEPIIVGENVYRYNTVSHAYIKTGIDGINYKSAKLYSGTKILVRKTGVGITAGMDYNDCLTNQVVYILKRKQNIDSLITNEVLLAILNSRVITYYIIMTLGSTGWKTHAYLSQSTVSSLPFPTINVNDIHTREILKKITQLVKDNSHGNSDNFPAEIDALIERSIAELFQLNNDHYNIIYSTIQSVQKMIPFKRLLYITPNMIFNNGI